MNMEDIVTDRAGRLPEDDADCERYGCEDRNHPINRPAPFDVERMARALRYVGLLEGGKVEVVGPDSLARDLAAAYERPEVS